MGMYKKADLLIQEKGQLAMCKRTIEALVDLANNKELIKFDNKVINKNVKEAIDNKNIFISFSTGEYNAFNLWTINMIDRYVRVDDKGFYCDYFNNISLTLKKEELEFTKSGKTRFNYDLFVRLVTNEIEKLTKKQSEIEDSIANIDTVIDKIDSVYNELSALKGSLNSLEREYLNEKFRWF